MKILSASLATKVVPLKLLILNFCLPEHFIYTRIIHYASILLYISIYVSQNFTSLCINLKINVHFTEFVWWKYGIGCQQHDLFFRRAALAFGYAKSICIYISNGNISRILIRKTFIEQTATFGWNISFILFF